jgi:hypothetical protein
VYDLQVFGAATLHGANIIESIPQTMDKSGKIYTILQHSRAMHRPNSRNPTNDGPTVANIIPQSPLLNIGATTALTMTQA